LDRITLFLERKIQSYEFQNTLDAIMKEIAGNGFGVMKIKWFYRKS